MVEALMSTTISGGFVDPFRGICRAYTAAVPSQIEESELEFLRGPITAYCYRMLGASGETDDAVQETLIRAWRNLDRFEPSRSRLSTWVHRITHHVCVDMLRGAQRRALSMDMGPTAAVGDPLGAPRSGDRFVEPMPDSRILTASDPGDVVMERHSVRLAFVAALQHLTTYQPGSLSAPETAVPNMPDSVKFQAKCRPIGSHSDRVAV